MASQFQVDQIVNAAGSGSVSFPNGLTAASILNSQIWVDTPTGLASTNTKIIKFSNTQISNGGSDITYTASATLGDSFTINTAGIYSISVNFSASAGSNYAIVQNGTALSTDPSTITYAQGWRAGANLPGSGNFSSATIVLRCAVNDVIRVQAQSAPSGGTATENNFSIIRLN